MLCAADSTNDQRKQRDNGELGLHLPLPTMSCKLNFELKSLLTILVLCLPSSAVGSSSPTCTCMSTSARREDRAVQVEPHSQVHAHAKHWARPLQSHQQKLKSGHMWNLEDGMHMRTSVRACMERRQSRSRGAAQSTAAALAPAQAHADNFAGPLAQGMLDPA